jgi:hypothetical protein
VPCVLPSNAPAPAEHNLYDTAIPNRVLQERCNNRQDDFLESDHLYRKGETLSQTDGIFFSDISLNPYTGIEKKSPAQIVSESNRLWHRLLICKQYIKYRSRQPKDILPNQDLKWPEHMEIAFCRGKFKPGLYSFTTLTLKCSVDILSTHRSEKSDKHNG